MSYKKGIDISYWQGDIDWEKVKADGIEFAMIRAGYGQNNIDEKFVRNITECNRLGIPCGVYWFSYAYTEEMAVKEAEYCINAVKPYKLSYPIAFDFEGDSVEYAKKKGVSVTKTLASAIARAFCKRIEQEGLYVSLYTNPNYLSVYFDSNLPKEYDVWLAQWPTKPNLDNKPSQAGGMWQYSSSGSVNGISGRVDMNVAYVDYPALITGEATPEKPWYEPYQKWAVEVGITEDGARPNDSATRAEIWTMLNRLYNYMKGE